MPKKEPEKKKKGTKKNTTTKVVKEVKEVKTVEPKVEVKKEKMDKKKGNFIDSIMSNTPFAISLCAVIILVAALILVLCTKKVPTIATSKEVVATVDGKNVTLKDVQKLLSEKYGEDATITLKESGNNVIAKVSGKTITTNDLYQELKATYGTDALINIIDSYIADKEVKITDDDKKYVQNVVDYYKEYADYYGTDLKAFLASYVGLNGIDTESEFYDYVLKDYKKTLAVKKFIADNADEKDLKEYYKNNYSDKLTVKHILIEVDKDAEDQDAAAEEAYNKAAALIEELNNTDKDNLDAKFEELAKDNSDDTATYSNGGLIESFSKKDVEEAFYNASEALKDGEYTTEAVKTSYGYHIILKVSSTPVEKYSKIKDEVKNAYAENLLSSDSKLQIKKWDELRKQYKLSIEDDFIKSLYEQTIKDATKVEENTENEEN